MGQVSSESVGLRQISGVVGQVDFVEGSPDGKGGISIIAIQSTAKGGTASRIVPFLDEGSAVTTNRNDVMHVCTEYGAVNLQGKTLRQRARDLIEIAHPDFRKNSWRNGNAASINLVYIRIQKTERKFLSVL